MYESTLEPEVEPRARSIWPTALLAPDTKTVLLDPRLQTFSPHKHTSVLIQTTWKTYPERNYRGMYPEYFPELSAPVRRVIDLKGYGVSNRFTSGAIYSGLQRFIAAIGKVN